MATLYKYKALSAEGHELTGEVTADHQDQVLELLKEQELIPIRITAKKRRRHFSLLGFFQGTDYENLIVFTNNLATLYRAGVPLLRALSIIRVGPKNSRFNYAIGQLALALQSGKPLSQAMEEFDDLFSRTFRASIAAGEESGKLDEILEELATMLEKEMELNRQIKAGIRYPVIVISAIAAAFVVLISFVIPRFVAFYGHFGAPLPLPTRIIIAISNAFVHYWWLALLVLAGLIYGFRKLIGNEKGKLWVDRTLLRIPIVGDLIAKGNVARFSLMFRILYRSGITVVKSLQILADSVKNSMIAVEIRAMEEMFRQGRESALKSQHFYFMPRLALEMITIGLESGQLEKMLQVLGLHYSKEVQYTSRQLTSILEPVLTLALGAFVLLLALAVLLPMWNLIKVFNP